MKMSKQSPMIDFNVDKAYQLKPCKVSSVWTLDQYLGLVNVVAIACWTLDLVIGNWYCNRSIAVQFESESCTCDELIGRVSTLTVTTVRYMGILLLGSLRKVPDVC